MISYPHQEAEQISNVGTKLGLSWDQVQFGLRRPTITQVLPRSQEHHCANGTHGMEE